MTSKKKKLVVNIVFYAVIALIYGFAAFLLITKFNKGTVYLFNTRFDVVLTDSMSEKNEAHLDFLEGTEQIQAFDVVKSEKINDKTEIKEKDVVLFTNPDMNDATVMHRVVRVIESGDKLSTTSLEKLTYHEREVINFKVANSAITLSPLDISSVVIEVISPNAYQDDYKIEIGGNAYTYSVSSEQVDGYYVHTIACPKASHAPMRSVISKVGTNESYVSKVTYNRYLGDPLDFNASEYEEKEGKYEKVYNPYYLYEIRGDKAKDSDGIYERKQLISKVSGVAPKLGYVVRFLTSLPGLIMIIGIALIITLGSYFWNKNSTKEPEKVGETIVEDNKEPESKKGEEHGEEKNTE